ncbi:MAG: type I 3-dehydroquinate dehydratase [Planctomycetota bacterium]
MSLLCATVMEATTRAALEAVRGLDPRADLAEIRLDAIRDPDPEAIVAGVARPLLFTCRAGGTAETTRERLDLLRRAIDSGAAWVDVDLEDAPSLVDRGATKVVVSHHDCEGTPEDLTGLARRLADAGGDVGKLVTTARRPGDVIRLVRCLAGADTPLAAHTMGAAGFAGRLLAARFGSAILYGAARPAAAGAPGQPTLRSLAGDYGLDRDLANAAVVFLLGEHLEHSVSPRMLNREFRRAGIDAMSVPWATDEPEAVLAALDELGAIGAAVTIPHKERVIPHLADLDASARATGAVNTVHRTAAGLVGHNTDLYGAVEAIRAARPELAGGRALLVGAGGAGRAIGRGLVDEGARLVLFDRDRERAERLAGELGVPATDLDALSGDDLDLIVNATPVGQWPDEGESAVPKTLLRPGQVVFDAVYNPAVTRLLADAEEAGARTVRGIEMLARQAARQVEIWFGREADATALGETGRRALSLRCDPIVIVGMRGAGKTSVGRILAARLGRDFVDLDDRIEAREGKSIPEIFAGAGEGWFRTAERRAFFDAMKEGPIVLATGGGVVTSRIVRGALKQAGVPVVWLAADADILAARIAGSDRPSLTGAPPEVELGSILDERGPLYGEVATEIVDAASGRPPAVVADAVLDALFD